VAKFPDFSIAADKQHPSRSRATGVLFLRSLLRYQAL
jgi:hypothetical protein